LYNLEPIGLGTELCESLTSYLARLAAELRISVYSLIELIVRFLSTDNYEQCRKSLQIDERVYLMMNGMDVQAEKWTRWLNELTGRDDLNLLTMLPWKKLLLENGLIRYDLHYCPQCLRDQGVLYIPLLWSLSPVKVCRQHGTILIDRCPNCFKKVPILGPNFAPGYCPCCGKFLGREDSGTDAIRASACDYWVASHFSDLVRNNHKPDNLTVMDLQSRRIFPIFLQDEYCRSRHLRLLANKLYVTSSQMRVWGSGHPIRFDLFLGKAFLYKFSPFRKYNLLADEHQVSRIDVFVQDFKSDRSAFVERVLDAFASSKNKIISFGDRKSPFAILDIDSSQLKQRCEDCYKLIIELFNIYRGLTIAMSKNTLKIALLNPPYFPSLNEISERLGVTKENLQIIAPDLCSAVIDHYYRARKARKPESDQRNVTEAIDCITQMINNGLSVNGSSIHRNLKRPGILRNPAIRAAVCAYLTELGIPTRKI